MERYLDTQAGRAALDAHIEREPEFSEDIEQEAMDLALNDCQMWDNLSASAQDHYRHEAQDAADNRYAAQEDYRREFPSHAGF